MFTLRREYDERNDTQTKFYIVCGFPWETNVFTGALTVWLVNALVPERMSAWRTTLGKNINNVCAELIKLR